MSASEKVSVNGAAGASSLHQHQTQQLLGAYPFASATPSTHVARHLSNLSLSAAPPSYIQPSYYSASATYGHTSTYQTEISHISTMSVPHSGPERAYWDACRSDVFRMMADRSATNSYTGSFNECNSMSASSSYQLTPFAHSVIQHAVPYNAYPTPPPAPLTFSSTSSSLANALGSPIVSKREFERYESPVCKNDLTDSTSFFNNFLDDRIKDLRRISRPGFAGSPSNNSTPEPYTSSPDPLCIGSVPASPLSQMLSRGAPKKRKLVEVVIETPSKQSSTSLQVTNKSSNCTASPCTNFTPDGDRKPATSSRTPRMQVFVEITSSKSAGAPIQSRLDTYMSSLDFGGYGSDDGNEYPQGKQDVLYTRSTGRRTGDRDDRAPLEKFLNLVDDIFEADDNVFPDSEISSLSPAFFSNLSTDPARPLLHPMVIGRLLKAISKVARPTKRIRLASIQWEGMTPGSPRKAGGMAEIEVQTLTRLLKLLERSVRAGEDLEPFGPASSRKPTVYIENTDTQIKADATDAAETSLGNTCRNGEGHTTLTAEARRDVEYSMDVTIEDCAKLERLLEVARESVLAADCCIALLSSDRLAKQLYSEELIASCLSVIKNSLTKIIYPFVEAPSSDARTFSPLLMHISGRLPKSSEFLDLSYHRRLIGDIFQALSSVFPRINNLVCSDGLCMPESIIIPAVYIAIGPFFVVEGSTDGDARARKDAATSIIAQTLGNSGMRGLRLEALSLIRSIFAYHEDQRSWIVEEILTSLVRLSDSKQKAGLFRLRDGRSIRTVSALLLQLVQTSAHTLRVEARRLAKSRQQQLALKRHDSSASGVQEAYLDEHDIEEAHLYCIGLEPPTKAAKAIVVFLTQRSGKGKSTKNTNELEYRAIFDNLISDLLIVLFWPEWPAASLVLGIVCKYMISALDDVKSSNNDNNASKALALDHLGVIASRLRANVLKWSKNSLSENASDGAANLKNFDELVSLVDKEGLEKLISFHQEVSSHLSKRAAEDHSYESARELNAVMWGQELATSIVQLNDLVANATDETLDMTIKGKYLAFLKKAKAAFRDLWKDAPTDVFDTTTQEEIDRADGLSEQLGATQALKNAFDPILNVIILALDSPAVFVRTKALRALSHILAVDSGVLSSPNVRHAIESHLLDSSAQVRDAAVELIGKYMIDSPMVAGDYYQKIAERIADTGLGVRKRVIKLLKSYYHVTECVGRKIDTCSKLVLRMLDEDDTVKDLSVRTLEELWFSTATPGQMERNSTISTVSVVMGVCSIFKDRQSPLEEMLCKIVHGKEGTDESLTSVVRARFKELYDVMIEGLVDASDFVNFTTVNCIRAIHLFTSAFPSVLTGSKASVLLPYLKNSTSSEDVIASDYILKIYRTSIPHMPKTFLKFGHDLQSVLQPMVLKPNMHGTSLQEIVACLCVVVQHLTHEFARLVALLKSCMARLQQFLLRSSNHLVSNDARALHILVVIVSLLGEHFDFDILRSEDDELSKQVDSISKGSIVEYIYACLLQLYDKYIDGAVRGRLLVCLGFLFRAKPTLMTLESSATMMDAIFASSEEDNRARLLKIMQEFLVSESTKHSVQQNTTAKSKLTKPKSNVDMEELVGNTRGFAESGVSSAVVQRYLNQILDAALSPLSHIQAPAVDILSFTIKQGLAHPLLSFPVIVALETSPLSSLSAHAVALHTILHHKHASLLNSGFVAACRKSYEYQSQLISMKGRQSEVRGFRMQPMPSALLGRWYALVREKRATRQEFLRAVLKVFELRDISKTDQDVVHFLRYMVENFASFDYRTQEEVLTVVKALTRELAETGLLLVERIAPGNLLAQLRPNDRIAKAPDPGPIPQERREFTTLPLEEQFALMRSACVIGMIVLLKAYLKGIYGLSEEKCQKFVMGKKSAVGDRPAMRRSDNEISWERMAFATRTIQTLEDMELQRATFLEIWNEDDASAEPDGDEWE